MKFRCPKSSPSVCYCRGAHRIGRSVAFRSMRRGFILWLIAGTPLLLGGQKSLEQLRKEIVHRRTSITFADQSAATVIVEKITPTSLSLRIVKTSNAQLHPRGQSQTTISSISKLTYTEHENLAVRIFRTAIASALSLGILAKCTWSSESYAVAVGGAVSSQTRLVVTPFELPGCEP
jgi:hypothetical protein